LRIDERCSCGSGRRRRAIAQLLRAIESATTLEDLEALPSRDVVLPERPCRARALEHQLREDFEDVLGGVSFASAQRTSLTVSTTGRVNSALNAVEVGVGGDVEAAEAVLRSRFNGFPLRVVEAEAMWLAGSGATRHS
jgi:hypothetical protein